MLRQHEDLVDAVARLLEPGTATLGDCVALIERERAIAVAAAPAPAARPARASGALPAFVAIPSLPDFGALPTPSAGAHSTSSATSR